MKKILIIAVWVMAAGVWSCSDVRREQRDTYMPDMFYSRALETYTPIDTLHKQGINYNRMPVAGTVKRGELFPFELGPDQPGDSTNYVASKQIKNPLPPLNDAQMKEAERLYLVNCGICHGTALDGNGPLYNNGQGPYVAQPANLVGQAMYQDMPEGQMFYSVTYGKGQMGSYASQLSTTQRWMVIHYVKAQQAAGKGAVKTQASNQTSGTSQTGTTVDTTNNQ